MADRRARLQARQLGRLRDLAVMAAERALAAALAAERAAAAAAAAAHQNETRAHDLHSIARAALAAQPGAQQLACVAVAQAMLVAAGERRTTADSALADMAAARHHAAGRLVRARARAQAMQGEAARLAARAARAAEEQAAAEQDELRRARA
jgi:hypothetical protein